MTDRNRRWIYARPVEGPIAPDHFTYREEALPEIGFGQTLVRVKLVSIDPTNRNWLLRPGYVPQVLPGAVMSAFGIGEVIETRDPYRFKVGDVVHGNLGWQDYAVVNSFDRQEYVHVCPADASLEDQIGVYGVTGLTAYFGLRKIGPARPGQTVLVAGTTGACGHIIAQLARIAGARVIGTAGGPEKCAWVRDAIHVDAVVDYESPTLADDLAALCPDGIDLFSDGVGGAVSAAAHPLLNAGAHVLDYGRITAYDTLTTRNFRAAPPPARTPEVDAMLANKGVRFDRLLVFDHYGERLAATADLNQMIASGQLHAYSTVIDGFDQLPPSLVGVFASKAPRFGKLSVRIDRDGA